MRSFSIEPNKIFGQLVIKGNSIFEKMGMMVNKFFLDIVLLNRSQCAV